MSREERSGQFTYTGATGFLHNGERRCTQAQLQERLSKPSTLSIKFLKAQLAHYAIQPLTGTKGELEARVRNAVAEGKMRAQPKGMKEMEKALKTGWEKRTSGRARSASPARVSKVKKEENPAPRARAAAGPGSRRDRREEDRDREQERATPAPPPPYRRFDSSPGPAAPVSPSKRTPAKMKAEGGWVTGKNPMTERQASFLQALCQQHNQYFNPSLTKAEASRQITELKALGTKQQQQHWQDVEDRMDTEEDPFWN